MIRKHGVLLSLLYLLFSVMPASAFGALIDLGNGLVEDTDQGIYWLKDANLYVAACIAAGQNDGSPEQYLWEAFDPQSVPGSSGLSKEALCSPFHGAMNWYEATAWVEVLNAQNYKGYNDWRLPHTTQPDPSCESQSNTTRRAGSMMKAPGGGYCQSPANLNCSWRFSSRS